jgi:hypothetical protein
MNSAGNSKDLTNHPAKQASWGPDEEREEGGRLPGRPYGYDHESSLQSVGSRLVVSGSYPRGTIRTETAGRLPWPPTGPRNDGRSDGWHRRSETCRCPSRHGQRGSPVPPNPRKQRTPQVVSLHILIRIVLLPRRDTIHRVRQLLPTPTGTGTLRGRYPARMSTLKRPRHKKKGGKPLFPPRVSFLPCPYFCRGLKSELPPLNARSSIRSTTWMPLVIAP